MKYDGYVYIWYDTKAKFWYVGGHLGKIDDRYVCSSKTMLRAYNMRPKTFKFRVLEYVIGDKIDVRKAEQKWLDLIEDRELMNSENVKAKTCRYYNVKKYANGGSAKGTNKGKSHPAWNKGMKMSDAYRVTLSAALTGRKLSEKHKKNLTGVRKKPSKFWYRAISPEGEEYIFFNLNDFCKRQNLNQGNMQSVCAGRLKQTKGWSCEQHPLV